MDDGLVEAQVREILPDITADGDDDDDDDDDYDGAIGRGPRQSDNDGDDDDDDDDDDDGGDEGGFLAHVGRIGGVPHEAALADVVAQLSAIFPDSPVAVLERVARDHNLQLQLAIDFLLEHGDGAAKEDDADAAGADELEDMFERGIGMVQGMAPSLQPQPPLPTPVPHSLQPQPLPSLQPQAGPYAYIPSPTAQPYQPYQPRLPLGIQTIYHVPASSGSYDLPLDATVAHVRCRHCR